MVINRIGLPVGNNIIRTGHLLERWSFGFGVDRISGLAGVCGGNQRHAPGSERVDHAVDNREDHSEVGIVGVGRHEDEVDAAVVVDLAIEFVAERFDNARFGCADTQAGPGGDRTGCDIDPFDGARRHHETDSFGCLERCDSIAVARR